MRWSIGQVWLYPEPVLPAIEAYDYVGFHRIVDVVIVSALPELVLAIVRGPLFGSFVTRAGVPDA